MQSVTSERTATRQDVSSSCGLACVSRLTVLLPRRRRVNTDYFLWPRGKDSLYYSKWKMMFPRISHATSWSRERKGEDVRETWLSHHEVPAGQTQIYGLLSLFFFFLSFCAWNEEKKQHPLTFSLLEKLDKRRKREKESYQEHHGMFFSFLFLKPAELSF